MGKHPLIFVLLVLVIVGLVLGFSVTDLWTYVIDFINEGIRLFIAWLDEIILVIRDSLNEAIAS